MSTSIFGPRTVVVVVVVVDTGAGVIVEVGVTVVFFWKVIGIVMAYEEVLTGLVDDEPMSVLQML